MYVCDLFLMSLAPCPFVTNSTISRSRRLPRLPFEHQEFMKSRINSLAAYNHEHLPPSIADRAVVGLCYVLVLLTFPLSLFFCVRIVNEYKRMVRIEPSSFNSQKPFRSYFRSCICYGGAHQHQSCTACWLFEFVTLDSISDFHTWTILMEQEKKE